MTGTLVIPEIFYPRLKNSGTNLVLNHIRPRMLLSGIETFGDDRNGFSSESDNCRDKSFQSDT